MTRASMPKPMDTSAGGDALEVRKERARAWFEALRDQLCAALEAIEDEAGASPLYANEKPGRFVRTPWTREEDGGAEGGGGTMALMSGRVFEKVGCHVSTVHGRFTPEFARAIPNVGKDSRSRKTRTRRPRI
jgi:coproporphyrinogen III oxidase